MLSRLELPGQINYYIWLVRSLSAAAAPSSWRVKLHNHPRSFSIPSKCDWKFILIFVQRCCNTHRDFNGDQPARHILMTEKIIHCGRYFVSAFICCCAPLSCSFLLLCVGGGGLHDCVPQFFNLWPEFLSLSRNRSGAPPTTAAGEDQFLIPDRTRTGWIPSSSYADHHQR